MRELPQQGRGGRGQLGLPHERREWQSLDVASSNVGVYCNKKVHVQGSVYYFTYCLSSNLTAEWLVKD